MATHTSLKSVNSIGDSLLSDQLEANLYSFFNWATLGVGGFFNVTIPSSGCYGGDQHRLRPVKEPGVTDGTIWEAFRKDWVWESGVDCNIQPIRVSGVYINNSFLPISSGITVDYPNGRVTLPSAISTTSTVTANYSYRLYQFYTADAPWWQELQTNSFRVDDSQYLQQGSGAWDVLARTRIQLPAVIVESIPRQSRFGKNIGGLQQTVQQDVRFHVLTEDRWHLKWMHDAITSQEEKTIYGFDKNAMMTADAYPLLPTGAPKPSGLMYPDLVKASGDGGFFWHKIIFKKMVSQEQPSMGNVQYCTVRGTFQVDIP